MTKKELEAEFSDLRKGYCNFPALSASNPESSLAEMHIQQYEVAPTEPLRDFKRHMANIIGEVRHKTTGKIKEEVEKVYTAVHRVPSTTPSRSTQQYEPQTMLGKQIVHLLEDTRLTHKFDKLRVAAKECEKGDRTHKRYERTAAKVKQALIEEYNRQDSEFKSWQNGYIASQKKHPNPEDIPPEIALKMRKRTRISTVIYHEWKLKLS
jgi:hypothetical protein